MSTMNLQAILHIPKSNYAYPVSGLDFRVRLRAGRGDLDSVRLVIGNQYPVSYTHLPPVVEIKAQLEHSIQGLHEKK